MDRAEWLAGLKPGDKVAIRHGGLGVVDYWICTIKHVTPTRKRFDVLSPYDQVWELDKDGYTKRQKGSYTPRNYIEPVTPEIRKAIRIKALRYKLEKLILDGSRPRIREDLTLEQMEAIISILEVADAPEAPKDA
jgi:hypothetical protein